MTYPDLADVAELADAQVSEACDGDIVEVQVLSSAPIRTERGSAESSSRAYLSLTDSPFLSLHNS